MVAVSVVVVVVVEFRRRGRDWNLGLGARGRRAAERAGLVLRKGAAIVRVVECLLDQANTQCFDGKERRGIGLCLGDSEAKCGDDDDG